MQKIFAVVALLAVVSAVSALAPLLHADNAEAIDGQYIVVFQPNTSLAMRSGHILRRKVNTLFTYDISSDFTGYAARLTQTQLNAIRADPEVAYVEVDQMMHAAACSSQSGAPWGLDRLDHKTSINLDGTYKYPAGAGSGVTAFIIDTGIVCSHTDFGGRCTWGANYVGDGQNTDCNGHGTHVAGTVAGNKYGVAKGANVVAVKVLGCTGSGTNAGVISGVDYAAAKKTTKSVANMSLGGGVSTALDNAVSAAAAKGVSFVLAAGNSNADACTSSPAKVGGTDPNVITVGATTVEDELGKQKDARASFSNWGKCVNVFAPGELIQSAWIGGNTATKTISGTSMASPHVCGVAAAYLSANSVTPSQIKSWIVNGAISNVIDLSCTSSGCTSSPNKLAHLPCA
jgi:subtilisin family serine protease